MSSKQKAMFLAFRYSYFSLFLLFLFTYQVNAAYIDPSVMTYAIQAIAGVAVALGTFFSLYSRKIKSFFIGSDVSSYKTNEEDTLEFHDPATNLISKPELKEKVAKPQARNRSFMPAVLFSFAFSFMLFFFSPFKLYFTNINEFKYDIYAFWHYIVALFLVVLIVLLVVFWLIHKLSDKLYLLSLLLGMICFLALYIQGNFLTGDLPNADGSVIDWSLYRPQMTQSAVLWVICIVLCTAVMIVFRKRGFLAFTKVVCSAVSGILIITLITLAITNNGLRRKQVLSVTTDAMNMMSSDRNFIILVMDAVDASAFSRQMETTDPEYKEYFEDFTYYPDTLSAYPYTLTAIPQIITGEWYECQSDYRSYFTNAIKTSPFLNSLRSENYIGGMYDSTDFIYDDPVMYQYENIKEIPYGIATPRSFILDEISVIFYLHAPYQLKKYRENAIYNLQNEHSGNPIYFDWYNDTFYEYLNTHEIEFRKDKTFKFIHLEGSHPYYRLDKNLNDIRETGEPNYDTSLEAAATTMHAYLEKLKDAGVYDNSVIIMLGDHGFPDGNQYEQRHNPMFMVKGLNEHHEFAVSDKAMSYEYLPEIYANLMNGKTGEDIYPFKSHEDVTRRYLWHDYNSPEFIVEYELNGKTAGEPDALKKTGREYQVSDK